MHTKYIIHTLLSYPISEIYPVITCMYIIQVIEKEVVKQIDEAVEFCEASPPPDVVETFHHVYKDASPSFQVRGCDPLSFHPHQ